jgi:group I intron endonuclease
MNDFIVYIHTFPNGKKYVGITCQSHKSRWRKCGNGYKTQSRVFRAISKYGWDNIISEIAYTGLCKIDAEQMEIKLIMEYKSTDKSHGYNSSNGGNSKGRNSIETRAKISAAKKGKKASETTRRNMSLSQMGRKHTESTKRILSEARKGIPKSQEVRQKISNTIKSNAYEMQRWRDVMAKQRKPVIQLSLNNEQINKYDSISIASHVTGICRNNINNCCLNKIGSKTAGGYRWEYYNEQR